MTDTQKPKRFIIRYRYQMEARMTIQISDRFARVVTQESQPRKVDDGNEKQNKCLNFIHQMTNRYEKQERYSQERRSIEMKTRTHIRIYTTNNTNKRKIHRINTQKTRQTRGNGANICKDVITL